MRIDFDKGLINAPGFLGFAPTKDQENLLGILDAFVSNPISYRPRKAASNAGSLTLLGSTLLHSGWPNPGLSKALDRYTARWERAELPIIPSLVESEPNQVARMVSTLEGLGNVSAIQLLLDEDFSAGLMRDLCAAALGELPLIAQVPMERCLEIGPDLIAAGAEAISMGASRGQHVDKHGNEISGRIYGPAFYPRALQICAQLKELEVPFIAGNGVYVPDQASALMEASARAVQLDGVLWKPDFEPDQWRELKAKE